MKELRPSVEVHLVSAVLTESEIQEILAFEVLDGAMTKLDPIKTIETIVEIIKLAPMRGNASAATDWRRLADARVKFGKANVAKLRALDEFLQARLGKTK